MNQEHTDDSGETVYRLPVKQEWADKNPGKSWFVESELALVKERQRVILRLRSGMDGGKPLSYKQVASRLGLKSPNSIRVEQNKAMHLIAGVRQGRLPSPLDRRD